MGLFGIHVETVVGCSGCRDWWSIQQDGRWSCVCVLTVQVALMSEVASARAVVDVNVGLAGVVEAWLGFLTNLCVEEANRVRC